MLYRWRIERLLDAVRRRMARGQSSRLPAHDHLRCPMKVAPVCAHRAGVLSGFVAAVIGTWRAGRASIPLSRCAGKNHYGCRHERDTKPK